MWCGMSAYYFCVFMYYFQVRQAICFACIVTVTFQHLAVKVKHFIPKPMSLDIKSQICHIVQWQVSKSSLHSKSARKNENGAVECELTFVKAKRQRQRRWSPQARKRRPSPPASLTFLLSCSCSCCHLQILGLPVESSSSSFPQPGLFLYFSGQCSVAFYLPLLHKQKTERMRALSSPSGNKEYQPKL